MRSRDGPRTMMDTTRLIEQTILLKKARFEQNAGKMIIQLLSRSSESFFNVTSNKTFVNLKLYHCDIYEISFTSKLLTD